MIIKNTSQIISKIIEIERKKIDNFSTKITHAPTIGKQFEGITLEALKYGFPKELNIQVVSGFVKDSSNNLSGQIDCMICTGDGEIIPGTDDYIYPISNVLAVIEIKKNLFTNELESAYEHLIQVRDLKNERDPIPVELVNLVNNNFARVSGKVVKKWEDSFDHNNEFLERIYHGLVSQFFSPLRIIIGYDGFSTEDSLRQKYADFLQKNQSSTQIIKGFGPFSFPDLIICGENCLVKHNVEPYVPQIIDNYLEFYSSSATYNITILTELILSRISRYTHINFEDDDQIEPLRPYLGASLGEINGIKGWEYRYHQLDFKSKEVKDMNAPIRWEPKYISNEAFILFNFLLTENISLKSELYLAVFNDNPNILEELLETKCIALHNDTIELTTYMLRCAILPDGRNVIGEDSNGYFTKWVMNETKSIQDQQAN